MSTPKRKLTKEETSKALADVLEVHPDEFEVELLQHLPRNIMDYLIDANLDAAIERWPTLGIDTQRQIASFGMAGFQLGWLLAKEVFDGRGTVL